MDARPQRPVRPQAGAGNEKQVSSQSAQQAKSTTKNNLAQAGKHANETFEVKRTAFGDMSNAAQATKNAGAYIRSNETSVRAASGQENKGSTWSTNGDKKAGGALQRAVSHLRPSQQQPEHSGLGRLATGEKKVNGAGLQQAATHGHKQVTSKLPWKTSEKTNGTKQTTVYHDAQPQPQDAQPHDAQPHDDLVSVPPKAAKDPRKIQSQVTLKPSVSLVQAQTTYTILDDLPQPRTVADDTTGRLYVDAVEHQRPQSRDEYPDMLAQLNGDYCQASGEFDDDVSEPETEQDYTTFHSGVDLTTGITTLLAPKVTSTDAQELRDAQRTVYETMYAGDYDEDEEWDVTMVTDYSDDIFDYLKSLEKKLLPSPYYMEIQTELQWSMRSILMDWIVQVHLRFQLLPETLFLCVNYIDRFLSVKVVSLGKLQLVGITALFLASKYEEINCPSLKEVVMMVDKGYSSEEILKAERFMLTMLQFDLGWPGPLSFLRRISKADEYDVETRTMSKYLLDVTIMDERFVATPPSYLAAGAQCLSRIIMDKGPWDHAHIYWSGYTFEQLGPILNLLLECCQNPEKHHIAVYNKYKGAKFHKTALVVQRVVKSGLRITNSVARRMTSLALPLPLQ